MNLKRYSDETFQLCYTTYIIEMYYFVDLIIPTEVFLSSCVIDSKLKLKSTFKRVGSAL